MYKRIIFILLLTGYCFYLNGQAVLSCINCNSLTALSTATFKVTNGPVTNNNYVANYTWKLVKQPYSWIWYSNYSTRIVPFPFSGTYKINVIVHYVRRSTGSVVSLQTTNTLTITVQ